MGSKAVLDPTAAPPREPARRDAVSPLKPSGGVLRCHPDGAQEPPRRRPPASGASRLPTRSVTRPPTNAARNEPAAPFDESRPMSQTPSPRARRTRRTEDEQIADLQQKIQELEERKRRMEAKTSPVRKDFDRFKKHANKFIQSCVDHGRNDLANSVMALINTVERQVDAD